MSLVFINPIPLVKDLVVSRRFYAELLGLKILQDFPVFVLFENHFAIHQAQSYHAMAFGHETEAATHLQGHDNVVLYFETPDLEGMFARLQDRVQLILPIKQQAWGQKVFRFYDPDHHIVEIGEPM